MASADELDIDRIAAEFFGAFRSSDDGRRRFDTLRALFLPDAQIVKVDDDVPSVMSVESFIEPREVLLNGGRLQGFSEKEVSAVTEVFGGVAQRWSLYTKSGILDGIPYDGWGRKALHFVRTADGWRISAVSWQDGADGTSPPGSEIHADR